MRVGTSDVGGIRVRSRLLFLKKIRSSSVKFRPIFDRITGVGKMDSHVIMLCSSLDNRRRGVAGLVFDLRWIFIQPRRKF